MEASFSTAIKGRQGPCNRKPNSDGGPAWTRAGEPHTGHPGKNPLKNPCAANLLTNVQQSLRMSKDSDECTFRTWRLSWFTFGCRWRIGLASKLDLTQSLKHNHTESNS